MDKQYLSPNMDARLVRTNLMKSVTRESFPYDEWIDPLDPRLVSLLDGARVFKTIIWNGTPITTIAHRTYGTTSLDYVILMFNGFIHPHEIPMGATLKLPTINTQGIISKPKKSQVIKGV